MRLTGIGASPGIGIGPVFRHEREEFAVREVAVPAERADEELARFRRAVERSRVELGRIRDGIARLAQVFA